MFFIKIKKFFWICVSCHLLNDISKNCNFYGVPLRMRKEKKKSNIRKLTFFNLSEMENKVQLGRSSYFTYLRMSSYFANWSKHSFIILSFVFAWQGHCFLQYEQSHSCNKCLFIKPPPMKFNPSYIKQDIDELIQS